jgi:hypothetical protein
MSIASFPATGAVCFAHGRIVDGELHDPLDDGFVLVEDGAIREVGPVAALPARRRDLAVVASRAGRSCPG